MRIFVKGRALGKTHYCIQQMKDDDSALLIVFCENEKRRIINQYCDSVLEKQQYNKRIYTIEEVLAGKLRGEIGNAYTNRIIIDNVDIILSRIIGYPIHLITLNTGEEPGNETTTI